ncbi:MAG: DUF5017 domain-containing protein [Muribaculaceae bacterium]|nr:DUF5017 domain-containing protein [Muribaculaceae bacterium]
MKKNFLYIVALLAGCLVSLSSCNDEFSQPPVIIPEGGIGTGEWDSPMTAYQCLIGSVNENIAQPWVKGYIVGVINTSVGNVLNARSAQFEGPFNINTNILLAMDPNETDWEKCASVQLPSGSVRDAINLSQNPGNLGKLVCLKGTLGEKYCGVYGLKAVNDFNWGELGNKPLELNPIDGPFLETFDATTDFAPYEKQGWKRVMILGGLDGWYIKSFDKENNNYVSCSAYLGSETGGPYENWLITPAIDLNKLTDKTLQFLSQAAYATDSECSLEVFVMTTDNPATSQNVKIDPILAIPPQSGYSTWVDSGIIDLSQFNGTIYIGWRYYSEKGGKNNSATYCIDDINVGNASEPLNPPVIPEDTSIYSGLEEDAASIDWKFDNILLPAGLNEIWSWKSYNDKHYLNASAFPKKENSEAIAYSPVISLAGVSKATVSFMHAASFQTTILQLGKFVVREAGNAEWTEFDIPVWPPAGKWTFTSSGNIDLSAFDGKDIEIGFKYASSPEGADTWEIRNVKVEGNRD